MNVDNPLVSILIPSYNHAKYITQTLDSIYNDSYCNKEIIIIDDGSVDNSVTVIGEWINSHKESIDIKFKTRENRGINKTLNELKSLANGDYYLIIASDDFLINNSIKKRIELLKKHPDKMVVFGDAHIVDENNVQVVESSIEQFHHGNKNELMTDTGILKAALFNPVFSGALDIVDKRIYDIIGDYPDNVKVEDWFFWQSVAISKKTIFINDYVSCYRRHDANMTSESKVDIEILAGIYKTCKSNIKRLKFGLIKLKFIKFVFILYLRCIKYGAKVD